MANSNVETLKRVTQERKRQFDVLLDSRVDPDDDRLTPAEVEAFRAFTQARKDLIQAVLREDGTDQRGSSPA